MAVITFFVKKQVRHSMSAPQSTLLNDNLLEPCNLFFKVDYQGITEEQFKRGKRDCDIRVQVKEQGSSSFLVNDLFKYHGPFNATETYIHNHRYISSIDSHFCMSWSDRENRFFEILKIDYPTQAFTRFIPTTLPIC